MLCHPAAPPVTGRTHSFLGDSRRTLLLRIQYFRNFGRGRNDGTEINATNLIFFQKRPNEAPFFRKTTTGSKGDEKDHQRRTAPSECRRVCPHAQNARDGRTRQYTEPEQCRFLLPNMRRFRRRTAAAVRHNGDSPLPRNSQDGPRRRKYRRMAILREYGRSRRIAQEGGIRRARRRTGRRSRHAGRFPAGAGQRYALVFGNEVEGVAQEVADMCDGAVEIPQAGTKHSLNVAVAGGAVLWHLFAGYISEKKAADETV